MDDFVSLDSVTFSFDGGSTSTQSLVLSQIDLQIARGEFFCLLGPSGCGKTTLLNILAGFEKPSSGRVAVFGREIVGPGADRHDVALAALTGKCGVFLVHHISDWARPRSSESRPAWR